MITRYIGDLIHKGAWYWTKVAMLIGVGIFAGEWLTEQEYWIDQRYKIYQFLQNRLPRKPHPQRTVLVLIGDEEYWKGELGGRVPIKRDYLAKMVQALDSANPAVIAFDFDLRSPSPDGDPVEDPAYKDETQKFLEAVKAASRNRKIVLPKTIGYDDQQSYVSESDIYNGYDFEGGDVLFGYIALPPDTRQVPLLSLPVKNGPPIDSFSQAIVRADNEAILQGREEDTLPYGSYMHREAFTIVSANRILSREPQALRAVAHKVVIVGGHWHDRGYGRGDWIDDYPSPIGQAPGILLHANYVEAVLDSRTYRPWRGWILKLIEVLQSLMVAIPFALETRFLLKVLSVVLVSSLLVFFSLLSLMVFGLFFDFFMPVVLVFAHGLYEQIREWKEKGGR
jgi:CHASE2 domain-containing sensor protein